MNDDRESFVARWARRKAGQPNDQEPLPSGQTVAAESDFDGVDFSALDINSDFTRFMRGNVPNSIRNRALQMLWASSDLISKPDDLDDFLEDFSEEAMALPPELAKSAYTVGAGFIGAATKSGEIEGDAAPANGTSHIAENETETAPENDTEVANSG